MKNYHELKSMIDRILTGRPKDFVMFQHKNSIRLYFHKTKLMSFARDTLVENDFIIKKRTDDSFHLTYHGKVNDMGVIRND